MSTTTILISLSFSIPAPVTVTDCTANQNDDCSANTDGKTVCANNLCSGEYLATKNKEIRFWKAIWHCKCS